MRMLLIGKVRVVDHGDASFVAFGHEDPSELGPGRVDAAGEHQRCLAEVDERHLAAVVDAPTVPEGGR